MDRVNLSQKLAALGAYWTPKRVARVNETDVRIVKVKGEFVWHHHAEEDELFLVLAGRLLMQFRDRDVWLEPGEMIVVPRGVEHRPVAPEETHVLLVEPGTTLNTGNVRSERTVDSVETI